MLSVTVKTMDSQSRQFDIEEQMTIKDFKEKIHETVQIAPNRQRLIFQGRVLPDDFILTKEHDGKVLHLVQRIPVDTTTVASAVSTTSVSTATSQTTTSGAGVFNPAQLSQMIFQQAMGGLGNLMTGSAISGSVGVNPNNPLEQMMNIHIDLNPNNPNQPRSSAAQTGSTTATPPRMRSQRTQPNRPVHSSPRQHLLMVERIFVHLNRVLGHLERDGAPVSQAEGETTASDPSGGDAEQSGDVFANENFDHLEEEVAMDTSRDSEASETPANTSTTSTQTQAQQSGSTATQGQVPTCHNHPSLGELGTYFTQMLEAQRRLEPFLDRTITFLNSDPPFESTQSPEFRSTSRLLSHTLQAQQLLAEVQRLLSRVVIPLGSTPPRSMLVAGPPRMTHPPAGARRINHLAHGGRPPFSGPPHQPAFPRFGGANMPVSGSATAPRMVPVAHGVQMRFRIPEPGAVPSQPQPTNVPSANHVPPQAANPRPMAAPTAGMTGSIPPPGATHFNVAPPSYTVQVNATIEPQVHINVGTGPPTAQPGSGNAGVSTFSLNRADIQQAAAGNNQSASQNVTNSTATPPSQPAAGIVPNIPNIPGVPQDVFSNIFQSVARSAQQQLLGNQGQPQQHQAPNAGIIVVQGPPGGPNQVSQDVSNILGQTVYNAVYNQLSGSSQPRSLETTNVPNVHFQSSQPASTGNARDPPSGPASTSASQTSVAADTVPMETSPDVPTSSGLSKDADENAKETSSEPKVIRSATELVSGGSFGSLPSTSASSITGERGLLSGSTPEDVAQMMEIIRREVPRAEPHSSQPNTETFLPAQESNNLFNQSIMNFATGINFNMDQPANQFVRQLGFQLPDKNWDGCEMPARIFYTMGEKLTCQEILGTWQDQPEALNKVRSSLQKLISSEYFSGKHPTSLPQIETAAHVLSEILRGHMVDFFKEGRVVSDVDIVESNLSLLRHTFKKALQILFMADNATFAIKLNKHLRYVIALWTVMNESLLRGGRKELVKLFKNFKHFQSESTSTMISVIEAVYMAKSSGEPPFMAFLKYLTTLSPVTQEQIDQFVLSEAPQNIVSGDDDHFEDAMETFPHNSHDKKSGEEANNAVASTSAGPAPSAAGADTRAGSGDSWKKEVPAEWVDTIVADRGKQKTMSAQLPFSDAYIAGMPASKRRKVVS